MGLYGGGPAVHGEEMPGDLRRRMPGQSVIAELLRRQAQVQPRRLWGRLFGISPLAPEAEAWYKGALGEIQVARLLARLDPGYVVLHAVPVGAGGSDIDHVVIGPAGVFTLNTKNHSGKKVWVAGGTFMVNGSKHPHIRKSVFEGKRAARLLSQAAGLPIAVTPLVVVVDPLRLVVKTPPNGVQVLASHSLQQWFAHQPRKYSNEQLAQIVPVACQPGLWHQDPPVEGDPMQLNDHFDSLHRSVRTARLRRILWALAMMGGLLVAVPTVYFAYLGTLR
ncbi:nuclease-related domain-containing protein [Arthrobacter sp. TMN-49]